MPRRARLDAAGTLHYVMVGGIERSKIVDKEHHRIIYEYIVKLCKHAGISIEELRSGTRQKEVFAFRADIVIGLVKDHGVEQYGPAASRF